MHVCPYTLVPPYTRTPPDLMCERKVKSHYFIYLQYFAFLTISAVLGNSFLFSWNFSFCHNLTDIKIELLERLMFSLVSVHLFPFTVDSQAQFLSSSSLFIVKSFFLTVSNYSNPTLFLLAIFLWKPKAPSKVMTFSWLVAHRKVNTKDMLQLRRPYKSLSTHWCILCKGNRESIDHLFLHCS